MFYCLLTDRWGQLSIEPMLPFQRNVAVSHILGQTWEIHWAHVNTFGNLTFIVFPGNSPTFKFIGAFFAPLFRRILQLLTKPIVTSYRISIAVWTRIASMRFVVVVQSERESGRAREARG